MSKPMMLGLAALGGFIVLGAGLYQLGGKSDQGKDLSLKAVKEDPSSKSIQTETKPAGNKRADKPARERKPIETKVGRDREHKLTEKPATLPTEKPTADSTSAPQIQHSAVAPEKDNKVPSASDFVAQDKPATGQGAVPPKNMDVPASESSTPTGEHSDGRLDALLESAQPSQEAGNATDPAANRGPGDVSPNSNSPGDAGKADTVAPPKEAKQPAAEVKTYRVSRGDTLALISEIHYGSQKHVDRILAANPQIKNPDMVSVGQELKIPPLDGPATAKTEPNDKKAGNDAALKNSPDAKTPADKVKEESYVVQDGDTLYSISEELLGDGTRWEEIFELNKKDIGDEPSQLKMGQKIKIPSKKPVDSKKKS